MSKLAARGIVHKYGNNVDTDVIIPARYLNTSDPKELASHCMEDIDKEFVNKVNIGLPILECPQAANEIKAGDEVDIDFDSGRITDITTGRVYTAEPFPDFIKDIINKGGLLNSIKK